MGFLDKKKNEEWIDGTPESFKIWFWIRLAVCLFLMYTGGDLIWRYIKGEVGWGIIILASVFILFGVLFLVWDLIRYIRLRRTIKERENDGLDDGRTTDTSSLGDGKSLLVCDVSDSPEESGQTIGVLRDDKEKPSGISGFAKYVVNDDEEDEADDDI